MSQVDNTATLQKYLNRCDPVRASRELITANKPFQSTALFDINNLAKLHARIDFILFVIFESHKCSDLKALQ